MNISSLIDKDLYFLTQLQPEGWKDITFFFNKYIIQPFSYPIKVTINDEIVGIGCCIIHHNQAWLGHIIVDKNMRNKGLGKSITKHLVEIANSYHCSSMHLIATELGYPVYEALGFKVLTEYIFFKKYKDINFPVIDSKIKQFSNGFLDKIYALDKELSGEDRKEEITEYLDLGYYFINDNELLGFYLPDFGEGLILAKIDNVGLELLKLHINNKDVVIIPKENKSATKFLLENNFVEESRAKRMIIGKDNGVKLDSIFNRIAGNLG